jgi:hypothetical protein
MTSDYLGPSDPSRPSHFRGAKAGLITEASAPEHLSERQAMVRDWFEASRRGALVPEAAPMEPLAPLIGYLHKLRVDRGGADFHYMIYGNRVSALANISMNRRWVSELEEPARSIFLDHYRELTLNPRFHAGILEYDTPHIPHGRWERATVPLSTGGGGGVGGRGGGGDGDGGVAIRPTHFLVYAAPLKE